MGHNVIGHNDSPRGILGRQLFQVANDFIRRLGPESHAQTVETAKGTVVFLTPPTAAAALVGQAQVVRLGRQFRQIALQLLVIFGKVRQRQRVELATGLAVNDPLMGRLTGSDLAQKMGKGSLTFARKYVIYGRAEAGYALGHLPFTVRPADNGHYRW